MATIRFEKFTSALFGPRQFQVKQTIQNLDCNAMQMTVMFQNKKASLGSAIIVNLL